MSAVMTTNALDMPWQRGAEISGCERYRYRLWRVWDISRSQVLFVMLNPSTADGRYDDPTIRRCVGYANAWGYGGIEVVNLYAYRATRPGSLKHRRIAEAIGPDNDCYIWGGAKRAALVVCAWGAHDTVDRRARAVLKLLRQADAVPMCLAETKEGHPSHPLYLSRELVPVAFDGARYCG